MEDLLTAVSQAYTPKKLGVPALGGVAEAQTQEPARQLPSLRSYSDALESLKSEPKYETLLSILKFLISRSGTNGANTDGIHTPSPQNAQIIQALVTEIVPNYWHLLKDEAGDSDGGYQLLLGCLRNLSGVNAILAHIKGLTAEFHASADDGSRSHSVLTLELLIDLLCSLLGGPGVVQKIWENTAGGLEMADAKKRLLTQELVNLIGGGRVVSLAAEAERIVREKANTGSQFWLASSKDYSVWLAQNLISWARGDASEARSKSISDILAKCFRLGHLDSTIKILIETLLIRESADGCDVFERLFKALPQHEQKRLLYAAIKYGATNFFNTTSTTFSESDKMAVSSVAGLLNSIVRHADARRHLLMAWLTDSVGAASGEPVGIRRAVVAAVADSKDDITAVFEKSLAQFGDQLYIRHTPLLQQEAHAQVLLLSAGYVQRKNPIKLALLVKSSLYLHAVSNRLGAPQTRARILGMIVGEALSGLAKTSGNGLNFDMAETRADEAVWYKTLVSISDDIGSVDFLRKRPEEHEAMSDDTRKEITSRQPDTKKTTRKSNHATTTRPPKPVIVEVEDSDDGEDDDLVPYAKPDSDPDDSEDDAELVRRDKPRAPVYIRDLIAYLRDTENYDRQRLALTTAPMLIRRKANHGTEVKEHAEELATLLVGLQDRYNMDDFADLRLQGMIAIFVAQPQKMGPWFVRTFFDGDYSLSQRASVLTAVGLGSRELAGYERSDYADAASFPSKRLPEKVERLYQGQPQMSVDGRLQSSSSLKALPPNAIEDIAKSITQSFLAPMAASAADSATGPDALKLASFTSRLRQKQAAGSSSSSSKKSRIRAIPNTSAQLLSIAVFFPLTARFQAALRKASSSVWAPRASGVVGQPELLSHLLRTLGLLVHAAGPSTLSLPDMTTELWRLLLQVRARCSGDLGITRAMLFALLALLDVNGAGGDARMRDVCRDLGREVVETQEWVALVFEGTRGGDGTAGEEDEVKMLAAGVLIRLQDATDKFRAFMIGEMI